MSFGDTSDEVSSEQEVNLQKLSKFEPKNSAKQRNGAHKCSQCKAVFTRPYRLKNHVASQHLNLKPFKCNDSGCDKTYTNSSHLKRHKITAHSQENDNSKEVICGEEGCGSIFINKYNLQKHILRIHQQQKYKCLLCDEVFQRKSQLNAHKVEIHNVEAPYKCSECDKSFVQLHLYHKHKKAHKTYKCDCEKSFPRWTEYLKHKNCECTLKQSEHECSICNKLFISRENLTQHVLKIHVQDSNDDNYKCAYLDCNRSYKYKKNLDFHMKTVHEKIFEYIKCTYENCEAVLKSKRILKNHLRIMHSKKLREKKPRKPRKDKGLKKGFRSMASQLSGIKVIHNDTIKGSSVVSEKLDNNKAREDVDDYNKSHMSKVLSILNSRVEASKFNKITEKVSVESTILEDSSIIVNGSEISSDASKLNKLTENGSKESTIPEDSPIIVNGSIVFDFPEFEMGKQYVEVNEPSVSVNDVSMETL
ncbi:unnamed protein product [Ceutorhynchus assimilis]|uniref:C2H2-type domain-containing protein n=1 Tax=Ceutorhynchus assimilis TaxID=467358 RepID=A0A9N9MPA5_9CUCU|nr:unnamed protein product [Ceutorhynchus assimilis]